MRIETRTGDTPQNRRKRQRTHPPDLLLTTPESLALLLSYEDAADYFGELRCVVLDELHALAESKRGALFSLALARLRWLAPRARFVGLSATVACRRGCSATCRRGRTRSRSSRATPGPSPRSACCCPRGDALGRPHGDLRGARRLRA